jgi:alpha-mannosidase
VPLLLPGMNADMTEKRSPLYYTFGNHMHWVDMEWLWGYSTLSGSVDDMLRFCQETGVKGHINFDGIGYEKLAVQNPETLTRLKHAVMAGTIEIVGASYGQPYGLFHGGESNMRQRLYGARTIKRLFDTWPRTFWEEEFDFFPQLPQMLRSAGFNYACLFFQWTWHTPSVPKENAPAIWWESPDGSRLLTAPRNDLNLHQWPEEFAGLLKSPELHTRPLPCLVQWLELMPSPDWMCRSELLLPHMHQLLEHPDFDVRPVLLPEFLELARPFAETRRYRLDEVFHGTSLGKNGDLFRRFSHRAEQLVLSAESISAMAGFFGRPYPSWDVYPTWELEEAWRELLSAQHHDNEECEGLCGYIGQRSFERSLSLSRYIIERTINNIARRTPGSGDRMVVYNPLGWDRPALVDDPSSGKSIFLPTVPALGYIVIEPEDHFAVHCGIKVREDPDSVTLERDSLSVTVDRSRGVITQVTGVDFPEGVLPEGACLADLCMTRHGKIDHFTGVEVSITGLPRSPHIQVSRRGHEGAELTVTISIAAELDAIDVHYKAQNLPRPDPWFSSALHTTLTVNMVEPELVHDHPYGVSSIKPAGSFTRKYPTGDWMTSHQVFETIENPFTALQFLDLQDGKRGLLCLHDGSQAFQLKGALIRQILTMYDAWDEDYFVSDLDSRVRFVPHGDINNATRWRMAQEFLRPVSQVSCKTSTKYMPQICNEAGGNLPLLFSAIKCDVPNVVVTAFYREMEVAGHGLPDYAGIGMAYPYILRLVELDGVVGDVRISLPGRTLAAYKTDLLGRVLTDSPKIENTSCENEMDFGSSLSFMLRPYEIATLYVDLEMGHKVYRDLDAERGVWAMSHKVSDKEADQ